MKFSLIVPVFLMSTGLAFAESADDIAKELSNPTTALASLNNNFEFKTYEGSLNNADDQQSLTYIFQPSIPFPMGNGRNLIFRPAIPLILDQPVFNSANNDFDEVGTELGDIGFDLAYGGTDKTGFISMVGITGSLPTATDDSIASDQWRLGPEVFLGVVRKWGLVGTLITHNWDVGGSSDADYSKTTMQYIYGIGIGNGWQVSAGPTITYDWEATNDNELSFPLGIGLSKTTKIGESPWKLAIELHKYVEKPENFGADWLLKFKVTPVIKNPFL